LVAHHLSLDQSQESNYVFLLELQQSVLKKMKAGVQVKELYDFTVGEVQKKKPDLTDKLVKSIGFGVSHAVLVSVLPGNSFIIKLFIDRNRLPR
jgi:nucleosome binding factor SPN SPT16 subunit